MTLDLSTNARKLIADSPPGEELAAFAVWLYASDTACSSSSSTFAVSPSWL